jgi:sugar-specific transcriptional regulator TrmB/predicted hydrocarbon binding protein
MRARTGLLELLVAHGIPEPAARIYLAAGREGPLTAAELARRTAIHRVHGYHFIRDLVERGLLTPTGHRPKRFAALPAAELIDGWVGRAKEEVEHLGRERDRLLTEAQDADAESGNGDGRRFVVIEGQPAIQAFLRKRFGAARKEILVSVGGFALVWAVDGGVDRALAEARARGVKVRLVSEVTVANLAEAKLFSHAAEMRHSNHPVTSRAVLIDRSQAALWVSGEDGFGSQGNAQVLFVTNDPHFVALTRDHHLRLWSRGVPVHERLVEMENPSRATIPVGRGEMAETFQRLREITELGMVATGLQEVTIDLPELIEAVAAQLGHQVGEQVEGRSAPEVARGLAEFYRQHSPGKLNVVKESPLTLKVTDCFACQSSPEIGRVLCPGMIRAAFSRRLGESWEVSKPDPTRHASRGCLFTLTRD